ncbi:MAG: hypothetical protein ACODAF_05205 [Actinomycetota bacterium]
MNRDADYPRRRAVVVAVLTIAGVATVAAAAGMAGSATYGAVVSGDEPQYLLTAISLGEDASLDVSDELDAERYRSFHEADLLTQAGEGADGALVSPHDPLLPALLALPVALGGWVAGKAALAVLAGALAGLTLWTAVRRFGVPLGVATPVVAVLAASAPIAVYGQQVYPEVPAALATMAAVAALTGPMRRGGQVALALAVVALPWLAVKYVPVAAALGLIGLLRLWRRRRTPGQRAGRQAAALAGGLAAAGAVYVVAHLAWYGGLTVYAAGEFFQANGGQLAVLGTDPDYVGRARRLVGLLVDRDFGLAAWQPAWLLAVPAGAALVRRRPAGWLVLAVPFTVAWLMATFAAATMHGWWFPGRQVVVVLPLAAIAIAWWAGGGGSGSGPHRSRVLLACGLGALGVWSYVWLAAQAAGGRLTWIVDFAGTADPWYRAWRTVLPDYLDVTVETWALQGGWLLVLGGAAVWAWRRSGREPMGDREPDSDTAAEVSRATPGAGAGQPS